MKQDIMKSLGKSLDILSLFKGGNDLSLKEITKASGINKSTAGRIVSTLVEYDFLKQREERGKYSLGTVYFEFTNILKSKLQFRYIVIPYSFKLSQEVHETVLVSYGNGRKDLFTEAFSSGAVQTGTMLRVSLDEHTRMSLHSTCEGKIFLADFSQEELQKYFNNGNIKRYTVNTITDINQMVNHLIVVKKEGVALDDEEHELGVRGIAAALTGAEGEIVGAIAIVAPSVRLTRERVQEFTPKIKKSAAEISKELGFRD